MPESDEVQALEAERAAAEQARKEAEEATNTAALEQAQKEVDEAAAALAKDQQIVDEKNAKLEEEQAKNGVGGGFFG